MALLISLFLFDSSVQHPYRILSRAGDLPHRASRFRAMSYPKAPSSGSDLWIYTSEPLPYLLTYVGI